MSIRSHKGHTGGSGDFTLIRKGGEVSRVAVLNVGMQETACMDGGDGLNHVVF